MALPIVVNDSCAAIRCNGGASAFDDWNPGLERDERLLFDVYSGAPKLPPVAVPWYVKAVEHQKSALALPGALDPFRRTCLHIVLGRGLLPQDEAFVLGFTMGASRCPDWQSQLFRFCARRLTFNGQRFSEQDVAVFHFAFEAASRHTDFALHRAHFGALINRRLCELRRFFGIDPEFLRDLYASERRRWPAGHASARLPEPPQAPLESSVSRRSPPNLFLVRREHRTPETGCLGGRREGGRTKESQMKLELVKAGIFATTLAASSLALAAPAAQLTDAPNTGGAANHVKKKDKKHENHKPDLAKSKHDAK